MQHEREAAGPGQLEQAALAYAQEGMHVFPLAPQGKTPLTPHGLEDATTDPMTIETWWSRWPEANIGIRTGDIVVVDEDKYDALNALCLELGETLPPTRVAVTASGSHWYFTQPEGQRIRNTAGKLAPGIDTRGDGGYVVAPPSIHPSGKRYFWSTQGDPAPLPDWVAERLRKKPVERGPMPDILFTGTTPYGERALNDEIANVWRAPEGTRNDTLNTAAFALGQLVGGREVDQADAWAALEAAARACGLPDAESSKTIRSGFNAGLEQPRSAPELNGGAGRPNLRAVPSPEPDSHDQEASVFMDAYDFVREKIESPPPLWGSDDVTLIPAGGLCLLAGRPGCGKTTFILDLACHLACGLAYPPAEDEKAPPPWPAHRPLRIALIENEGPREMFRAKLEEKLSIFPHQIEASGKLLIQTWRWGSFSFADPAALARSAAELDAEEIDLVIGDPLGTLGPAGVGSPQDTREFVGMLKPLGLGLHRAFLFLHHFRERAEKTEDELARISGAWGGHLDTLITLSATSDLDQARLAYPKLRWRKVKEPSPIIMGRIWNTLSYAAIAEEGDATILEPLIYEFLAQARAEKTGRAGEGWHIATEIHNAIHRNRTAIVKALKGAPHLFESRTGEQAKALGARKTAVLWGLKEWTEVETTPPENAEPPAGEDIIF